MKKLKGFILVALLAGGSLFATPTNPFEKKAPFKEAVIVYKMGGSVKGESRLYIKDYGKRLSSYEKTITSVLGFSQKEEKLEITTPDWKYVIDLGKKTGTKSTNPEKYIKEEFNRLSFKDKKTVMKNAKELGLGIAKQLGGGVVFNAANILGYPCDKATVMGMSVYSIHDTSIPLKTVGSMLGINIQKEAIDLREGGVDEKWFKIPSGIKITYDKRADAMAKQQAKSIIEALKDPNAANKRNHNSRQIGNNPLGIPLGNGNIQQHSTPSHTQNQPKGYVDKKIDRAQNEVEQKADNKVNEMIDQGINKVFNSLFK